MIKIEKVSVKVIKVSFLKVLGAFLLFLLNLLVINVSGAEQAGLFFWVLTLITFISVVCRRGYERTLIKYSSIYIGDNKKNMLFSLAFHTIKKVSIITLLFVLLLFFLNSFIVDKMLGENVGQLLMIMAWCLPCLVFTILLADFFQGLKRPELSVSLMHLLIPAIVVLVLGVFYRLSIKLEAHHITWIYTIASVAVLIVGFFYFFRDYSLKQIKRISKHEEETRVSNKLYVIVLMEQISKWGVLIVAGFFLIPEEIAYLNVAQRIAMLSSIVLMGVNTVVSPYFATMIKKREFDELKKMVKQLTRLLVLISVLFLIVIIFFSEKIMLLFGPDFVEWHQLVLIIGVSQAFNVSTGSVGFLLMMGDRERYMRNNLIFCACVSLILSFTLIPIYGLYGAAIAISLPLFIQNLVAYIGVLKFYKINTLNFL